jgi:hypothetical protein
LAVRSLRAGAPVLIWPALTATRSALGFALSFAGAPAGGADAIHREVWKRYAQGDEDITRALRVTRDSVEEALRAHEGRIIPFNFAARSIWG